MAAPTRCCCDAHAACARPAPVSWADIQRIARSCKFMPLQTNDSHIYYEAPACGASRRTWRTRALRRCSATPTTRWTRPTRASPRRRAWPPRPPRPRPRRVAARPLPGPRRPRLTRGRRWTRALLVRALTTVSQSRRVLCTCSQGSLLGSLSSRCDSRAAQIPCGQHHLGRACK